MPNRPTTLQGWLASGQLNGLGAAAAGRVRAGGAVRRAGPGDRRWSTALLAEQVTNGSSVRLMEHAATLDLEDFEDAEFQDQLERARRQTSGRLTLMGQLFSQAQDARDGGELRRRPAGLRAVADRAAAGGAGAGLPRRGAFQRPDLHARFRPHARAARARLRAPDRGQRRDRQGSEDLRPQRLPDRALQAAAPRLLRRQPRARA